MLSLGVIQYCDICLKYYIGKRRAGKIISKSEKILNDISFLPHVQNSNSAELNVDFHTVRANRKATSKQWSRCNKLISWAWLKFGCIIAQQLYSLLSIKYNNKGDEVNSVVVLRVYNTKDIVSNGMLIVYLSEHQ